MTRRDFLRALASTGLGLPVLARAGTPEREATPRGQPSAKGEKDAGIAAGRERIRLLTAEKKLAFPLAHPSLKIRKADRQMDLHAGPTLVKLYAVALGLVPEGAKRVQGDYKTPEGSYRICYLNYDSAFHLFLGLSYPNAADAAAGLAARTIEDKMAERIRTADAGKKWPPWGSSMGGAVGIHGGGSGSDWTWGCIAVSDEEIDEIWAACPVGTPVEIVP